jgi:hypothetical protein
VSTAVYENLYQEELYSISAPVVVVLNREWKFITEDERALLAKILGSVKLNLSRVQIISKPNLSLASLELLRPSKVLVFGSSITEGIAPYENHTIGSFAVIKADDLAQLDDVRKKNLWLGLKQMFGV